jgi:hypothetical protein
VRAFLDLAIAFTRAWVAVYSRGLPPDVGAERREEIDCDLWHQQRLADLEREPVTGTAVQILVRAIFGIPADILWRIEAGSSTQLIRRTSVNDTTFMRIGLLATMLPLAILAVMGASFMLGNGDFENTTEHWLWRVAFVATPAIGGVGLWLCATQPRLGMALVLAGVGSSAFLMPWMAIITVPIALVIIAFALKRSGLAIWPFRPSTTGAA